MKRIEKLVQNNYIFNEEIRNMQYSSADEKSLEALLVQFQSGNFSQKTKIYDLMSSNDRDIQKCAAVIGGLVGTNKEIECIFDNVEKWEDTEVQYFIAYSVYFLASNIGKFLFDMYDEWEETYVCSAIENSLSYYLGIEMDEEIGEAIQYYDEIKDSFDINKYYFNGELIDYDFVCYYVLEQARYSFYQKIEIGAFTEISILTIVSGLICPVNSHTIIDQESMVKLGNYLDKIKDMGLSEGEKYFWGHQIQ